MYASRHYARLLYICEKRYFCVCFISEFNAYMLLNNGHNIAIAASYLTMRQF